MISLLMIDDDVEFCATLRDYLISHQIRIVARHDGASGLAAVQQGHYDLILLDVMLRDFNGLEVLRRIRSNCVHPVLLLSAEGSDDDRIAGLDNGADDYLPKPFNPRELVSRINAVLRRSERRPSAGASAPEVVLGLAISSSSRQAFYRGQALPLTGAEFDLLTVFAESPGCVLEREDLVTRVFQKPFNPLDRSLDMHVSRLRRKLAAIGDFTDPIRTIRNAGYLFSPGPMHH